jgi:catechol 2,3-dioxygenase-like lactoylglutathione lyase family enzyme
MLGSNALVGFVATTNFASALSFYRDKLGLTLVAETPFALEFDAAGTQLRVTKVETLTVAPYTVLGWAVPDIAAAVRGLASRGIAFVRFGGLPQDELGIWTSPGGARVAWFKDSDGNLLSLTQAP